MEIIDVGLLRSFAGHAEVAVVLGVIFTVELVRASEDKRIDCTPLK